jgi:hypothetical protein
VLGFAGRFLRLRCRFCRIFWFFLSIGLVGVLFWLLSLIKLDCVACHNDEAVECEKMLAAFSSLVLSFS